MTRIESDEYIISRSPEEVFNFLSDCNNLQKLMPEQVTDWQSTASECSFTIKGMATLGMEITDKVPSSRITVARKGKAPFDFTMFYDMAPAEKGGGTRLNIAFDADLNPFLKMMAEKPLRNFLNILAGNFQKLP